MPQWIFPLVSLLVGLISGLMGAYLGLRMGLAKLEWNMGYVRERLEVLGKRSHLYNEDLLIHDSEIGQVMNHLQMPRVARQSRRLDT